MSHSRRTNPTPAARAESTTRRICELVMSGGANQVTPPAKPPAVEETGERIFETAARTFYFLDAEIKGRRRLVESTAKSLSLELSVAVNALDEKGGMAGLAAMALEEAAKYFRVTREPKLRNAVQGFLWGFLAGHAIECTSVAATANADSQKLLAVIESRMRQQENAKRRKKNKQQTRMDRAKKIWDEERKKDDHATDKQIDVRTAARGRAPRDACDPDTVTSYRQAGWNAHNCEAKKRPSRGENI